jgi:arylsulfatase A-like enzyme
LHLAGIKTADRLAWQLWQEVEANPSYKGKTTMLILPEFGRDPDGSTTNGFFNHRAYEDSTRETWMMALGAGVERADVIDRPVRHIDVCPTVAGLLGYRAIESQGLRLSEFRA